LGKNSQPATVNTFVPMKNWIAAAAISAALAVILGALGAHALKSVLPEAQLASFETAVRYHIFHSLALLLVVVLANQMGISLKVTLWLFALGTFFFSGSIYCLATIPLHGLEAVRFLGPITPVGGLLLIAGWISLAIAALKSR
jgi:uncharacterized membrane protein YgdD (TMEM256/DUF423 family)